MTRGITKQFTFSALAIAVLAGGRATPLQAQGSTEALMEEIVVTARKRTAAESAQDTPLTVTAFGEAQLEALHFRDLSSLSYGIPNVSLDDIGTAKGTANFAIRGLGVNSSIPSIEPTVGVFVDGLYMGVNAGVVFDMFDLEGVEVLRGPQGLLFGRNVTGGAIVLRTKKPSTEREATAKVSVETGLNRTYAAVVSGPLDEGKKVLAKLAVYVNDDEGWFENLDDGSEFGRSEMTIVRPALAFNPTDDLELLLRFEQGDQDGDGPAGKNHGLYERDNFDFSVDERGRGDLSWEQAIAEANWRVGFGDGVVTNILGWRQLEQGTVADIDSTSDTLFHAFLGVDQEQFSNELRYAGSFGRIDLTSGLYYFTQDLIYQENRLLLDGASYLYGGGIQDHSSFGVFTSFDYRATEKLTLTAGLRYTQEEKDVDIAALTPGPATIDIAVVPEGGCAVEPRECNFAFQDSEEWSNLTPKLGMDWKASEDLLVYGFWTKGFRSGGYNLRNTSPTAAPGPFDEEKQDSFETGLKSDLFGGRLRVNGAVYYNEVEDLQREINLPDPTTGLVQVIRNTADATIWGAEADLQWLVTDQLLLMGSFGYTNGEYDEVRADLNGDGVIDSADLALELPRLAPWTYSAGFNFDHGLGRLGDLTWHASLSHRDRSYYTDNNRGFLNSADMLEASVALATPGERLNLSLYGKNLLDETTVGGDTQLPFFPGATFSPLSKGRIVGIEAKLSF